MNGIELDRDELAALILLLSASRIFGVADVVPAEPSAREAVFATGLEKLLVRGLVNHPAAGKAVPDTGLLRLVSVIVDPRVVIVTERASGGDAAMHYADDDGYVSFEGDAVQGYRVGWVDDTDMLARRVLRFLEIDPDIRSEGAPQSLSETGFSGARELARSTDAAAARAVLVDSGVAQNAAAEIAPTLLPDSGGHVLVIRLNAGRAEAARRAWVLATPRASIGWIGWRASAEDPNVRLEPLSTPQLAGVLDQFIQYLSPARA